MHITRFCNLLLIGCVALAAMQCHTAQKTTQAPSKPITPQPGKPQPKPPVDTVAWKPGPKPGFPERPVSSDGPYRIAMVLPFLTNQFSGSTVPEKSRMALQFYGGAKLAAEQMSRSGGPDLQIDVVDSQLSDAEFQSAMRNPLLGNAQLIIGPFRPSHVGLLAPQAKSKRQIVLSPETPNSDLVKGYPDFLQCNPSLRAHCEAIALYVLGKHASSDVTLLCKQKEANRLAYFQDLQRRRSAPAFRELLVPDNTVNFSDVNLEACLKPGRTSVFIVPNWADQDFVNGLLRKLKASRAQVEVYGMPQWVDFENIDPEFLRACNVHIAKADFVDYQRPEVTTFQKAFYDAYGTIPDEDAFNGYDVTLFTGQMLRQYGLSFPDRLNGVNYRGLRSSYRFVPVSASGLPVDSAARNYDYQENSFVHILKFESFGYVPVN